MTTGIRSGSELCHRTAALLIASALAGVLASAPAFAQGQQVERRWELDETPYDQQNFVRKVGSNLRDGTVGLIDSIAQGVLSVVGLINPRSGGVALQKVATFGGDIVGLIDNNPGTQYVFKGIISRQLLRFGASAKGASQGIAFIHDTEFEDVPGSSWRTTWATRPSIPAPTAGPASWSARWASSPGTSSCARSATS